VSGSPPANLAAQRLAGGWPTEAIATQVASSAVGRVTRSKVGESGMGGFIGMEGGGKW
jgi:hypothetical protein